MVLVGDSGVGKSCLLKRFASNDWDPKFISTIGVDFEILTLNILDKQIRLQIVNLKYKSHNRIPHHMITHIIYMFVYIYSGIQQDKKDFII